MELLKLCVLLFQVLMQKIWQLYALGKKIMEFLKRL